MSRKISETMATAFRNNKNKKSGNTEVVYNKEENMTILYLHSHAIAKYIEGEGLYIRSAGWETPTTKERLNALPGVSINQKDYQWYLNGEKWTDTREWTKVQ